MTERPILFSAPMVLAILNGRKTQTRRIIKPQPSADWRPTGYGEVHKLVDGEPDVEKVIGWGPSNEEGDEAHPCPYGQPHDRLWVRESAWYDREVIGSVNAMRCFFEGGYVRFSDGRDGQAPGLAESHTSEMFSLNSSLRKKPSIHMPRWASRITLEITDVRVERLRDIPKPDVIAEGITERNGLPITDCHAGWHEPFAVLWGQINGDGSWDANPWVWVVAFRPVKS
jgi:hypothetical protein